jgi:D-glycerate 3-kinase
MTIQEFHEQIFKWTLGLLEKSPKRPLIIGVSAPQGAGKTTLTSSLCRLADSKGLRAVALSIDDFYLTRADQARLSQSNPLNPYLQQRGYPGTHDIEFGVKVLTDLAEGIPVKIPRYDKSAFNGLGDRAPKSQWHSVSQRQDLVFFEGWMLGFRPVPGIACPDENFAYINSLLASYKAWTDRLDAFCWLEPQKIEFVIDWRIEAEEKMKATGKPGMSEDEIRSYILKFIPAYQVYLPGMRVPPEGKPNVHKLIGRERLPK